MENYTALAPDNKRGLVQQVERFTADNEWDGCHSNGILISIGHISTWHRLAKLVGRAIVLIFSLQHWMYLIESNYIEIESITQIYFII